MNFVFELHPFQPPAVPFGLEELSKTMSVAVSRQDASRRSVTAPLRRGVFLQWAVSFKLATLSGLPPRRDCRTHGGRCQLPRHQNLAHCRGMGLNMAPGGFASLERQNFRTPEPCTHDVNLTQDLAANSVGQHRRELSSHSCTV